MSYKINTNNEICRLITLTFEGRIKSWYEALPTKSIQSWDQFMEICLAEHHNNDPDELSDEFNSIWKEIEEYIEPLFTRMTQIWCRCHDDDRPLKEEFLEAYEYIII